MSSLMVPNSADQIAFEQIEDAVKETVRGRWFLEEFAKRNRHADTKTILGAIHALQDNLASQAPLVHASAPSVRQVDRIQGDILEMARVIARTEQEIRAIQPSGVQGNRIFSASDELDAVVDTTEQATSSILAATEKMQEYAWTMREQGAAAEDCDMLDGCATDIYTACSFQDVTAQRIRKVVGTLRFLDQRIKSMLEVWGLDETEASLGDATNDAPVTPSQRPSDIWMSEAPQAEIDDTFEMFVPAASSEPTMIESGAELDQAAPIMATPPVETAMPAHHGAALFAAYDDLSLEERLRAFR